METTKARRKSFDVEYVEVTPDNLEELAAWCGGEIVDESPTRRYIKLNDKNAMNTHQAKAFPSDLILKAPTGFKKYGRKSFEKAFDDIVEIEIDRSAVSGQFISHEDAVISANESVHETVVRPA